ncbi:MAG: winged helix DNA-binding domain-containing protein [Pseudonocardiaceae bacterium]|nr:winged helix DNA-binding domain-containing protein [Pseudonocardiaceae bacterium]
MTTLHEIALLRLAGQRLVGPGFSTATEAVRWLTAMQAQDHPGAITSIAIRTEAASRETVEAALNAGEVVKSWPMRGTLHFVPAEDLPWMLDLAANRVIASAASRYAELGLDEATFERATQLTVGALAGGRQLRRDDLFAVWDAAGLETAKQRGYHLIRYLAMTGILCFGPTADGEQRIVLLDEWVPRPRRPDRDEALGEWASRYFRGHGPATARDFAWWAKLVAADVKTGLAVARPGLERLELDGAEYFLDPRTPERLAEYRRHARGVLLLPGFDEYLLGYQDRGAALPAEFAQRVVPGNNGVFQPTVVVDGEIVGTWKRSGRGAARKVLATPFTTFPKKARDAIPRLYQALP